MQHDPRNGMHQYRFAECRPRPGAAPEIDRCFLRDEGEAEQIGDAASAFLEIAQMQKMSRQLFVHSTWPYMIVDVVRSPTACAVPSNVQPLVRSQLSGHRMARTSSSRISAAVPGTRASPASFNLCRKPR